MNDEYSPPSDHARDEPRDEPHTLEENLKSRATWLRLFFMIVLILLYGVSRVVLGAVVCIQFFWLLFKGEVNEPLRELGQSLAVYSYQIIRYLTFNTEERPYPFDQAWPSSDGLDLRDSE
jgi:hypothetical protein